MNKLQLEYMRPSSWEDTFIKFGDSVDIVKCSEPDCLCCHGDHFHCPYCSSSVSFSTQHEVLTHLDKQHWNTAVQFKDLLIVACHQICSQTELTVGHYHCPLCRTLVQEQSEFLIHLRQHLKEQNENVEFAYIPDTEHPASIVYQDETIELCEDNCDLGNECETAEDGHYHCPDCKQGKPNKTTMISHLRQCSGLHHPGNKVTTILPHGLRKLPRNPRDVFPMWHKSIVRTLYDIPARRCQNTACCKKQFHCPLCVHVFGQPMKTIEIRKHFKLHVYKTISYKGYTFLTCHLKCGEGSDTQPHYHCGYCGHVKYNPNQFRLHLKLCQRSSWTRPQKPSNPWNLANVVSSQPQESSNLTTTLEVPTWQNDEYDSAEDVIPNCSNLDDSFAPTGKNFKQSLQNKPFQQVSNEAKAVPSWGTKNGFDQVQAEKLRCKSIPGKSSCEIFENVSATFSRGFINAFDFSSREAAEELFTKVARASSVGFMSCPGIDPRNPVYSLQGSLKSILDSEEAFYKELKDKSGPNAAQLSLPYLSDCKKLIKNKSTNVPSLSETTFPVITSILSMGNLLNTNTQQPGAPVFGPRKDPPTQQTGAPVFGPRKDTSTQQTGAPVFGPRKDTPTQKTGAPVFGPRKDPPTQQTGAPVFGPRKDPPTQQTGAPVFGPRKDTHTQKTGALVFGPSIVPPKQVSIATQTSEAATKNATTAPTLSQQIGVSPQKLNNNTKAATSTVSFTWVQEAQCFKPTRTIDTTVKPVHLSATKCLAEPVTLSSIEMKSYDRYRENFLNCTSTFSKSLDSSLQNEDVFPTKPFFQTFTDLITEPDLNNKTVLTLDVQKPKVAEQKKNPMCFSATTTTVVSEMTENVETDVEMGEASDFSDENQQVHINVACLSTDQEIQQKPPLKTKTILKLVTDIPCMQTRHSIKIAKKCPEVQINKQCVQFSPGVQTRARKRVSDIQDISSSCKKKGSYSKRTDIHISKPRNQPYTEKVSTKLTKTHSVNDKMQRGINKFETNFNSSSPRHVQHKTESAIKENSSRKKTLSTDVEKINIPETSQNHHSVHEQSVKSKQIESQIAVPLSIDGKLTSRPNILGRRSKCQDKVIKTGTHKEPNVVNVKDDKYKSYDNRDRQLVEEKTIPKLSMETKKPVSKEAINIELQSSIDCEHIRALLNSSKTLNTGADTIASTAKSSKTITGTSSSAMTEKLTTFHDSSHFPVQNVLIFTTQNNSITVLPLGIAPDSVLSTALSPAACTSIPNGKPDMLSSSVTLTLSGNSVQKQKGDPISYNDLKTPAKQSIPPVQVPSTTSSSSMSNSLSSVDSSNNSKIHLVGEAKLPQTMLKYCSEMTDVVSSTVPLTATSSPVIALGNGNSASEALPTSMYISSPCIQTPTSSVDENASSDFPQPTDVTLDSVSSPGNVRSDSRLSECLNTPVMIASSHTSDLETNTAVVSAGISHSSRNLKSTQPLLASLLFCLAQKDSLNPDVTPVTNPPLFHPKHSSRDPQSVRGKEAKLYSPMKTSPPKAQVLQSHLLKTPSVPQTIESASNLSEFLKKQCLYVPNIEEGNYSFSDMDLVIDRDGNWEKTLRTNGMFDDFAKSIRFHKSLFLDDLVDSGTESVKSELDLLLGKKGPGFLSSLIDIKDISEIPCPICCVKFSMSRNLLAHMMTLHIKFRCPDCQTVFTEKGHFVRHMESCQQSYDVAMERKSQKCGECTQTFDTRQQLDDHQSSKHKYKLLCFLCDPQKVFINYKGLFEHIRKMHFGTTDTVPCDICGKLYAQRNLSKHRLRHTQKRVYQCPTCGKTVKDKSTLKIHEEKHKPVEEQTFLYVCQYCGKGFRNKSVFKDHINVKHTGEKTHECTECGKWFKCLPVLSEHKYVHHKIREFKCEICDKAFKFKVRLSRHMFMHTKKSNYKCPHCNEMFARLPVLKKHVSKCNENSELDASLVKNNKDMVESSAECLMNREEKDRLQKSSTAFQQKAEVEFIDQYLEVNDVIDCVDEESVNQQDYLYMCSTCNTSFPDLNSAENHIRYCVV